MTSTDGMPNAETLAAMAESKAAMKATKRAAGQQTKTASPVRSYRDLLVWQKGMELTELVYAVAKLMPKEEQYRITSQMLRSAASVPANIAEGHQRGTRRDYANFISIARGSLAETETFLMMACRVGLLSEEAVDPSLVLAEELSRMLRVLRHKLATPAKTS